MELAIGRMSLQIQSKIKLLIQIAVNTVIIYKSPRIKYYNQRSLRYFFEFYGKERMAVTACAPFACAMVASTLLKRRIAPEEVAKWSYENGFYEYGHGSLHSLSTSYCQMMGLKCEDVGKSVIELKEHLKKEHGLAIVLCRAGTFARGRHFIVVGEQNGKFKVYNSSNVLDCYKRFDEEEIQSALAVKNVYIGPIWHISKEKIPER